MSFVLDFKASPPSGPLKAAMPSDTRVENMLTPLSELRQEGRQIAKTLGCSRFLCSRELAPAIGIILGTVT
jgi:hypothetical protein